MRGFDANNCRLCTKVFCCEKCRIKHEIDVHKVEPDCDLCIYGKYVFRNSDRADSKYLTHLEAIHLPLNCVYCGRIFSTIEDIVQHKKCPIIHKKEDSPKTPFKQSTPATPVIIISDQDSPILQELLRKEAVNYIFSLATSTPMQTAQEPVMFEKSKESITPVEKKPEGNNKSIIKKKMDLVRSDNSSKRRVTFGEIRANNSSEKNSVSEDKQILKKDALEQNKLFDNSHTPVIMNVEKFYSSVESDIFYSAKTEVGKANNSEIRGSEGFTSVCSSNHSKKFNSKGDIYLNDYLKEQSQVPDKNGRIEVDHKTKDKDLTEEDMDLCTSFSEQSEKADGPKHVIMAHTPVSGTMNVDKFHTANKSEIFHSAKTEHMSKTSKRPGHEGFTPVSQSNIKGDHNTNDSTEEKSNTKEKELSEMSIIDLRTPDKLPLAANYSSIKTDEGATDSPLNSNRPEHEEPETATANFSTPAISGKSLPKGPLYTDSEPANEHYTTPATKMVQNPEEEGSDKENVPENNPESGNAGCKTLWLSAINLEDSMNSKKHVKDGEDSSEMIKSPESPKPVRRVSIVMPTPILQRTDVKMKFHLPGHFSSTPIMSSGAVKIKQTKIVEEISSRVMQNQQSAFRTPREKFSDITGRTTADDGDSETFSGIDIGPSSTKNDLMPVVKHDNYSSNETNPCRDTNAYECSSDEMPVTGISVSSMTESTLWNSMTRIVKSVLGFNKASADSNFYFNNNSTSFKRQLSDSDSSGGELFEAPKLKRFKFTDIKCRRPIRDTGAIELRNRLPPAHMRESFPTFEIVKSVTTLYEQKTKMMCDKACQTDDYLMYGWIPKS